jgi:hypothetical protein
MGFYPLRGPGYPVSNFYNRLPRSKPNPISARRHGGYRHPKERRYFGKIHALGDGISDLLVFFGTEIIFPAIPALLCRRCPSAIFRRIITVIIDTVQGKTLRPRPHISQEVFKAIPALANLYAAAAVSRVIVVRRAIASPSYARPRSVLDRIGKAVPSIFADVSATVFAAKSLPFPFGRTEQRSTLPTISFNSHRDHRDR